MVHRASHRACHRASHRAGHMASHKVGHRTGHSAGQGVSHSAGQGASHGLPYHRLFAGQPFRALERVDRWVRLVVKAAAARVRPGPCGGMGESWAGHGRVMGGSRAGHGRVMAQLPLRGVGPGPERNRNQYYKGTENCHSIGLASTRSNRASNWACL